MSFLSTLSLRRATAPGSPLFAFGVFLSTLSLRRATHTATNRRTIFFISIHALLAESDLVQLVRLLRHGDFYPRSPCGERPFASISSAMASKFLSTLSLRRATVGQCICRFTGSISIHALLAESDWFPWPMAICPCYFYPRSPCGERRPPSITPTASRNFYPRSPCGERPSTACPVWKSLSISIHALLAESDHIVRSAVYNAVIISIHALLAESDYGSGINRHAARISIHALLAESDPGRWLARCWTISFLSTLSLRRAT